MRGNVLKGIVATISLVSITSFIAIASSNSNDVKVQKISNITSKKVIQNWSKNDLEGYKNYIADFNAAGKCCYNMCVKHIGINAYDYGYKDSYAE